MQRAFKVEYNFAASVELSDEDRQEIVKQVITQADELDRGEDETFVFTCDWNGKAWKVYVDIGRRRITILTPEEAARVGLPGAAS